MTNLKAQIVDAEIANLIAATAKINAEADNVRFKRALCPMFASSGLTLAIVVSVKLLL